MHAEERRNHYGSQCRDELIPMRSIVGWRVCMDYRKLNAWIEKDNFTIKFMDRMLDRLDGKGTMLSRGNQQRGGEAMAMLKSRLVDQPSNSYSMPKFPLFQIRYRYSGSSSSTGVLLRSCCIPVSCERDDRAVEEEQNDIVIPEKETSPIVESSPISPSPDNFIVKSISFLCPKDVSTNIPKKWILLSADRKAFSAYPWGRISYDITIKHLLKAVKTIDGKTTNLYGFPRAFMCWAFEVVPFLQNKYKVFSKQVSSPRIFQWLLATNNESVDINELFDPPQDSIVHPWIIPTSSEMEMEFFTTFVPKKLTKDDKIEKLEMDLNGVVAIKRDIIIDEHNLDVGGGGASSPIVERVLKWCW
ncbi:hypothetical protein MTR67_002865 [Solanum verrucosum]|uniref:Uncharacterized protein n=1 Tax=Solanum verrucosum TaxID=315347 RepID=A0AAF0PUI6_SOLVR|nr:hypothetical protein MTR67_002865 [Solanum verrucosum]